LQGGYIFSDTIERNIATGDEYAGEVVQQGSRQELVTKKREYYNLD